MDVNTGEIYDFSKMEESDIQELIKKKNVVFLDDKSLKKKALKALDGKANTKIDLKKDNMLTRFAKKKKQRADSISKIFTFTNTNKSSKKKIKKKIKNKMTKKSRKINR